MFKYPLDSQNILRRRKTLRKQLVSKPGLVSKRVALFSGTTIGEVRNVLELFLLDQGIFPDFFEGGFGRYYEDLVFDNYDLNEFSPDIIYIHTGIHNINNLPLAGESPGIVKERMMMEWEKIKSVLEGAKSYGCPVISNNFEYPSVRVLGNREAYDISGKIRFISELNLKLADYARDNNFLLINDINYLSGWYGLEKWADPSYFNSYKYGLSPDAIPLLCLSISSIIKSVFGKNKKVLMLDLDDTLWGGVIGDDGLDGIRLGLESPEGMAFSDLQHYVKQLRGIGILLGVLSKNDEISAESGFSHPSSELSRTDFSVFFANWDDKPDNLSQAANNLNIDPEHFVFVDDNPYERELMEHSGLGAEIAYYTFPERLPESLSMSGYFEVSSLSDDDLKRADMYHENQIRQIEQNKYSDYGEFLKSLNMKVYFSSFSEKRQQRITQLVNKTNQFNLITVRYTPDGIAALQKDLNTIKITARLSDRFGDNGIVSCLAAKLNRHNRAVIVLFVMSCRVFKRGLELAMFDELINQVSSRGVSEIEGIYTETQKNSVVKNLYKQLGFEIISEENKEIHYLYHIPCPYYPKNKSIEVIYEQE